MEKNADKEWRILDFMSRKPTKSSLRAIRQWRVTLVRAKGQNLGLVEAPDAATAINVAIERFEISDPERQRRLIARRIGE